MNVFKQARFTIPLIIFAIIVMVLWRGLSLHPNQVPSPLVNKAAPPFQLPTLFAAKQATQKDFLGKVTLFNVWASWCYACAEEHEFILHLAKDEHVNFYGLNYKDDPETAKKWLQENGNPYQVVAVDHAGIAAIDWGVYGAPETFIIDKKGIIRYKHIGPITAEAWEQKLKPLLVKLEQES